MYLALNLSFLIGSFHFTSSPPCWWTVNKRSLISWLCLSTSICSFHHGYLCLQRLHENHLLFFLSFLYCDFALSFHGSLTEIVIVIQNFSNNADTRSSTYYKRCCVTAIWFILLILPVTWSLFAFERYVGKEMKKSKLRFKQMFLPSISSVTNKNNGL